MKPLRDRLQLARKNLNVPWEVIERDYILSWILAGIHQVPVLNDSLVFKGGTALKKCYFGDYRFSEDLDYTALLTAPKGDGLERAIQKSCEHAAEMLDEYVPVEMISERYVEREPHPHGQEAFIIRTRFPWHKSPQARVMIEITMTEKILCPIAQRKIVHTYDEPLDLAIPVYALEEIIAEKLRAILQHVKKLKERGWSRSRARDYYDLWRIFHAYQNELNLTNFFNLLTEKCEHKNVSFNTVDDFFEKEMLAYIKNTWQKWLEPLVRNLPSYDDVILELKPHIESLIEKK